MRRVARIDENQKEIVEALRKFGAVVLHLHQLKNCFDVLVFYAGHTYCIEIKNPAQPKSKQELTEGEQDFKQQIESVGVKYHIVKTVDDAIDTILSKL